MIGINEAVNVNREFVQFDVKETWQTDFQHTGYFLACIGRHVHNNILTILHTSI